jgi:replication factor C small subunit
MSYDFSNLWIEKFRPKTLSDFISTSFTKGSLLSFKNKEEIPNLLFTGAAGIGKTSAAKIIVNDILECQYLYINASDENGIDTIRNKVMNFAQTMSIDGKIKVIILDECLDENTLVTILRNGVEQQIPIKQLDQYNDLVKSYSIVRDVIEFRPFYLWDKGEQEVYEIEFENDQKIICTGEHKWYVYDPTGVPIKMKLSEIIEKNIDFIITKSDGVYTE